MLGTSAYVRIALFKELHRKRPDIPTVTLFLLSRAIRDTSKIVDSFVKDVDHAIAT